jgi:hypothetical protein
MQAAGKPDRLKPVLLESLAVNDRSIFLVSGTFGLV